MIKGSGAFRRLYFWFGAVGVGLGAVAFARIVSMVQARYFEIFRAHPAWTTLATPIFFVLASGCVAILAPQAGGSGIPQVLQAIELSRDEKVWQQAQALVSLRTAFFKVISTTLGLLGGASVGREGPTVQIAASIFGWFGRRLPRTDPQTLLVAGASAGVAAAFNTPLAGITFALEEIAEEGFAQVKQNVILAVVVSGITAQGILGDYLYFGHPAVQASELGIYPQALLIGALGGAAGCLFARLIARPPTRFLPQQWWSRALLCGVVCAAINWATRAGTGGSGYEIVRGFMDSPAGQGNLPMGFGLAKFVTTILSYLSGMAGGIFSPCLSIGSGLGFSLAHLLRLPGDKICALLGMVAFFSGVVQAPLTAVIIVMEMTDEHRLVIPFLIAALMAQRLARVWMPVPVYKAIAMRMHAQAPWAQGNAAVSKK